MIIIINDIQKLARDAKIRGINKGVLVYPKQDKDSKFQLNHSYSYKHDESFSFELRVIDIAKEKNDNKKTIQI